MTALMAYLQKKYESTPFTGRRGTKGARSRREAREAIQEVRAKRHNTVTRS